MANVALFLIADTILIAATLWLLNWKSRTTWPEHKKHFIALGLAWTTLCLLVGLFFMFANLEGGGHPSRSISYGLKTAMTMLMLGLPIFGLSLFIKKKIR